MNHTNGSRQTHEKGYGLCECGCGEKTTLARVTVRSKGWTKGKPLRFRRGHAVLGRRMQTRFAYPVCVSSELELGWIAGLIEGEGSFSIKKGRRKHGYSYRPLIQLASTDEDVINRLQTLVPAGSICKPTRLTKGGKQVYKWALSNSEAVFDLLVLLFPLMSGRRKDRMREILAHPSFLRYECA